MALNELSRKIAKTKRPSPRRQGGYLKSKPKSVDQANGNIDVEISWWQTSEWLSFALACLAAGALLDEIVGHSFFRGFRHGALVYSIALPLITFLGLSFYATATHELGILRSLPHELGPRLAHEHICNRCSTRWNCARPYYCKDIDYVVCATCQGEQG